MRTLVKTICFLLTMILLTGCKDRFEEIKVKAMQADNAWDAALVIRYRPFYPIFDISDEDAARLDALENDYAMKAIESGNPDALEAFFTKYKIRLSIFDVPEDKARQVTKHVIELADHSNNDRVLLLAGNLLQQGRWVIKDSIAAIGFYERAWRAGALNAASRLAEVYKSLRDDPNAYLWSLRYQNKYNAGNLDALEFPLSSSQILDIQRIAQDPTRLTVQP